MNLPRFWLRAAGLVLVSANVQAAGPDASWLPASTVGYVAINDAESFFAAWDATPPGKLFASKPFQSFFQGVWEGQGKDPLTVSWLQGLTLEDVRKTGGGLVVAVVAEESQPAAVVLILDGRAKRDVVEALLKRVTGRLEEIGATRSRSGPATVFDLPARYALGTMKQLAYATRDGLLVASNRPGLVQDVLAGKAGKGSSLADSPAFQATTAQALKEAPGARGSWFADPLPCLLAWRGLTGEKVRGQDMLKILRKEGFTAIKGAGGATWIDDKTGDLRIRGLVRAPEPYQRAMKMMAFTDGANIEPPAWVPADVSSFGTAALKFSTAFEAYGHIFDALNGEGEEGVFDEVVKGLRDDPVGPRVDVRKDLVARLRSPALFLERPGSGNAADNWLLAAPVEQPQVVARAVDRLFKDDRSARRVNFGEHGLWEVLPDKVSGPAKGGNGGNKGGAGENDWTIPGSAIAVHKDMLLLGGSPEVIQQLFRGNQSLARDADFQRITAELDRQAGKTSSLRMFYRLGAVERQSLSELRSGKSKDAQTMTRLMRSLLLAGPDRPNGGIDFRKLPAPEEVKEFLAGSGGLSANLTEDTWSFVFLLQGK